MAAATIYDLASISAHDLEEKGFFHPFKVARDHQTFHTYDGVISIHITWRGDQPDMMVRVFKNGASLSNHLLSIVQSTRLHAYFICPMSGKRVETLYLSGNEFGSREALGLRYPCQKISAREYELMYIYGVRPIQLGYEPAPNRRPPATKLPRFPDFAAIAAEDERHAEWHVMQKKFERQLHAQDTVGGLWRAIEYEHAPYQRGAVKAKLEAAGRLVRLERDHHYRPLPRKTPIELWESHARIDLRTLAQHGYVRPGARTWVRLAWSRWIELYSVYVCLDLTSPASPFVELVYGHEQHTTYHQKISLTPPPPSGRHRYRFLLEGYGGAEVLAFRSGRFAPRTLQRLVHQSQRKEAPEPVKRLPGKYASASVAVRSNPGEYELRRVRGY